MHNYYVVDNRLLTPTIRLITLECDETSAPILYQPGQYAAISLRDRRRPTAFRCFSIASSPTNQEIIQFSIRVNGHFTKALERLQKGDPVAVRGPFGAFVLNQHQHQDLVMFAGGIGVAPFMSMIRYATELKLENKLHLVYSSRGQDEIAFYEELSKLEQANPNLTVTHVIGDGPTDKLSRHKVLTGFLDDNAMAELGLPKANQTYMTCGPPRYMSAVRKVLSAHGVPKDRILSEAFSQSSGGQTGKLAIWPFNMYAMSGIAFAVIGFAIVVNDLYQTLPSMQIEEAQITPSTNTLKVNNNGDLLSRVNSLGPQVDTDLTQAPVIKKRPSNRNTTTTQTPPRSTVS